MFESVLVFASRDVLHEVADGDYKNFHFYNIESKFCVCDGGLLDANAFNVHQSEFLKKYFCQKYCNIYDIYDQYSDLLGIRPFYHYTDMLTVECDHY